MTTTEPATQKPTTPPKAGRKRRWARFDLPVVRPSSSRNQIARRLV
jgi:hypothetical protein